MRRPGKKPKLSIQQSSLSFVLVILVFSTVAHLVSVYKVPPGLKNIAMQEPREKVKVKIVTKPKPPEPQKPKEPDPEAQKILEVKEKETERPKVAQYKGQQNHQTEKETRVKPTPHKQAQDPGQAGEKAKSAPKPQTTAQKPPQKPNEKPEKKTASETPKPHLKIEGSKEKILSKNGKVSVNANKKEQQETKSAYQELLPTSQDLSHQIEAGYQDYVDENLALGDKIDINTVDYRYISYFTSMRKAIELVWVYPAQSARRGHQGTVGLQFTIYKTGKVENLKIVNSSGYPALDQSIVEAIQLASPFAPLPDGFGKSKLTITGNFRYLLNSFAVGH